MNPKAIQIQSQIKNYRLEFVASSGDVLNALFQPEDVVFLDQGVAKLFPHLQISDAQRLFLIESNEQAKEYIGLAPLIENVLKIGISKRSRIIGIGGGVVQDISGFLASILLRGIDWHFFPTNLLTQCDSCIGSKTSINFKAYKNQLGGFYPPNNIYVDFQFLKTLPEKEIRSGLGEMLHYALVDGIASTDLYRSLFKQALKGGPELHQMIVQSLSIKAKMIEIDEFDRGPRNVFNYGHTFGHALESATNYQIPHGIAVGIGINMANALSQKLGYISQDFVSEVQDILKQILPDDLLPSIDPRSYLEALKRDKKNVSGHLCPILTRGYGMMFKDQLPFDDQLFNFLRGYFERCRGKAMNQFTQA